MNESFVLRLSDAFCVLPCHSEYRTHFSKTLLELRVRVTALLGILHLNACSWARANKQATVIQYLHNCVINCELLCVFWEIAVWEKHRIQSGKLKMECNLFPFLNMALVYLWALIYQTGIAIHVLQCFGLFLALGVIGHPCSRKDKLIKS